jgi:hypothetical protein
MSHLLAGSIYGMTRQEGLSIVGLGKQYARVWIEPSYSQAGTLVSTNWAYRAEWNWFSMPLAALTEWQFQWLPERTPLRHDADAFWHTLTLKVRTVVA